MTTMISEIYDAFRDAGVSEEKARKAAEALSSESLATKQDITRVERELAVLKADLAVLKWGVGLLLAGVAAQLLKSFLA